MWRVGAAPYARKVELRIRCVEWCLLVCGKDIAFQGYWGEDLINCAEFVALGGEDAAWYEVTDNGAILDG
jgi:hypothetical protein